MSMNNISEMDLEKGRAQDFEKLIQYCMQAGRIDLDLYAEYDVKRGLRDSNGKGVLTGLTEISDVCAYERVDGRNIPSDGKLFYQGYDVVDLVKGNLNRRYAFEETSYLLLFGQLPNKEQLTMFTELLSEMQDLSGHFLRDVVMKASNPNIMNAMQRCILTLYTYDKNPEDISIPNVLRQSLGLIAKMPQIAVSSYHAYRHFRQDETLLIRHPKKELSVAENILYMLRENGEFTELEAKVLDISLVIHADHGGGNNSTFTTHVVTSTGTDTYSAVAASIGSLKGPRHGGANLKVEDMLADIRENCKDWTDEAFIRDYLNKILDKQTFDKAGLIYGMGHAVYTESDPRCTILKEYARNLAKEKGLEKELALYELVEKNAGELIMNKRKLFKPICANVDFYSGFVYKMLGIPNELFTPIFAISRISGWCAHRLEELVNQGKIIRPAYKYVGEHKQFIDLDER